MDSKSLAHEWLRREPLDCADMLLLLKRDSADIAYAEEDGVLLFDRQSRLLFAAFESAEKGAERVLRFGDCAGYMLHSREMGRLVQEQAKRKRQLDCVQAVYTAKAAPAVPRVCSLKPLTMTEAAEAMRVSPYADVEEFYARVVAGEVYGAFISGTLVGYIGTHAEGGLGLLNVSSAFRRRGVGEALVADAVKRQLARSVTPMEQIERTNIASLQLVEKLGFQFAQGEYVILL